MKKLVIASLISGVFSIAAVAAPQTNTGSIEFTGSVNSDTCKIVSPNGSTNGIVSINMGSLPIDDIGELASPNFTASSSSSALQMDIICKTAGKVTMAFAAQPSNLLMANKILKVNSGSTSVGVGIAVYKTGSKTALDLAVGKLLDAQAVTANGSTKVSLDAAYVKTSTGVAVTPGTANASLPFVLTYE